LLATVSLLTLLAAPVAHAGSPLPQIADQNIPSGKTLVVPIPAADPSGPPVTYTVTVGPATVSGTTTLSGTTAGVVATIRTGDPHLTLGVTYTDSNSVLQTGTMEFQLLRELAPLTTQIIGGLTQGGFYSPRTTGSNTKYITFHRVLPGFVIQGGDPNGDGSGGPGFTFPNEFSSALIFSATSGQLAMANSASGVAATGTSTTLAFSTLHTFSATASGTNADGAAPSGGILTGTDGSLYGTAQDGGLSGDGTLFHIFTTGTTGATLNSFSTLNSFTGAADGANPYAGLTTGADGSLYGTTKTSGSNGQGTIFQLVTTGSTPTLNTLYAFTGGNDGGNPYGALLKATDGNLYGTTEAGGTNGYGTVFQFVTSGSTPTLNTLYSFTGGNDGGHPFAGLIEGSDGNLYGATETSGTNGQGTLFQITTSGSLSTLYSFSALVNGTNADGANPYSALIQATDGNFYGTTIAGGAARAGAGTVFQLVTSGTAPVVNTLHSFTGGLDGGIPRASLIQGTDGNLYGTTQTGGVNGAGTVFQLVIPNPASTSDPNGVFSTIHSFSALLNGTNSDGASPVAPLTTSTAGTLFGVAETGGTTGNGTVFEISGTSTVSPTSAGNGTNGSQFFVTLAAQRSLDYGYNIFGQLLRGNNALFGIAGTDVQVNAGGEVSSPVNAVDITSAAVTHNDTDAVLLLSATGVCDAPIKIIAVTGTTSVTGTFTAHAIADATDDPPYLHPVPDITAPNGTVKVPLQGTDLQLDLLRYGFQRILPVLDPSSTSGTSPVISIPLVSNTDNAEAATVDHWISTSPHGANIRAFHVGAGDKPLRGTLAVIPPGANGGLVISSTTPLVTFIAGNSKDTAASFTASVNWGDGTYVSGTTAIQITKNKKARTVNGFLLTTPHTYSKSGQFPIIVNIADAGGARLALTGTANISGSSIAISGADIYKTGGVLKNQLLATFTDPAFVGDTASIDWGDGSNSAATIKKAGKSYQILGTHKYLTPAAFTVSATVSRAGASASEWSTAHIAGVSAPQVFPPFPQAHLAQIWVATSGSDVILTPGNAFGADSFGGVTGGTDGYLYGATTYGGFYNDRSANISGFGTIYRMTTSGSLTKLHDFTGADGANPYAAPVFGTDGNLYGTTEDGGPYGYSSNGFGTVYQITPAGSLTTLHAFTDGTDGAHPYDALIQGTGGDLYGTTEAGGANGSGSVFQITTTGALTTLYSFTASTSGTNTDGAFPFGSLVTGSDGTLYGTTESSGTGSAGTVFALATTGSLTTLHYFTGGTDGGNPYAGLVTGTDGNLYGTTEAGGSSSAGTVYRITTSGSLTTLHSFTGGTDGGNPYAGLVTGSDGNLYGTTEAGGNNSTGTVYQITTTGSLTTLYSFGAAGSGNTDGANPFIGSLYSGTDGNLYGTTEISGSNGAGTVYKITTSGSLSTLYSFTSTSFQRSLRGAVQIVNSGNKPSVSGSFSAYVQDQFGQQTPFYKGSPSQTSIPIPALLPGKSVTFTFSLQGSVVDTRLKLPVGFDPTGQTIYGVVTYSDPVGDFDGSQKIISVGSF
jgi:uncharacterized repeat protein (TIGR03803 family)